MKIKKGESRQLFWTVKTSAADNSESKQSDFVQFSVSFLPLQQRRQSKWLSVIVDRRYYEVVEVNKFNAKQLTKMLQN